MAKLRMFLIICLCFYVNNLKASYLFSFDEEVVYDAVDVSQIAISDFSNTKKVDIYGGQIDTVASCDSSIINIYNGKLKNVSARFSSTLNIFGGQNKGVAAFNSGSIFLYGGGVQYLEAYESSMVYIYGYNISYELYSNTILSPSGFPIVGKIFGLWGDLTPFVIEIGNYNGDVPIENPVTFDHIIFHEIPEPASLLLLGLGTLAVGRWAKKK
jgi:hypothetical protein